MYYKIVYVSPKISIPDEMHEMEIDAIGLDSLVLGIISIFEQLLREKYNFKEEAASRLAKKVFGDTVISVLYMKSFVSIYVDGKLRRWTSPASDLSDEEKAKISDIIVDRVEDYDAIDALTNNDLYRDYLNERKKHLEYLVEIARNEALREEN